MSSVAFRLTIYQANGTTPDLTMTSIRSGTNPYIVGVPSGDGQEVDLLTGAVRSGAYNIEVADVVTGSDGTGTVRLVTNKLEDSSFRQQLLSRRAKLEMSRNNGSTWSVWIFGYLTALRQVDAITYSFTVSDSRRIEATHTAFTWSANPDAATDEQREFPNRGCLIGGPTLESFGPMKATGGWEYLWQEVQGRIVALNFVAAYNPPSWARNATIDVIPYFNALRPFLQTLPPIANLTGANFQQIRERQFVYGSASVQAIITAGSSVWKGTVRGAHTPPSPGQNGQGPSTVPNFGNMNFMYIDLDPGQSTSYPSANTFVRIQLIQKKVSEVSPLYIAEHPVDIVTKLYDTVNIPYDASSATAVKALIGDDLRLALRITEPVVMGQFLAQSIFGPFGFSARTNASGAQEFFTTRIARATTPTISITDDDVVGDTPPPIFELDETSVVTSFRLTTKTLTPFISDVTGGAQAPPDGITETETTEVVQNADLSTFSTREVAYKFPGMLYNDTASTTAFTLSPEVVGSFFTGILAEGFDRFGRGAIASEVQVLATSSAASLQVGDEVLIDVGFYPNKNYRIGESSVGSRIAQIVRRTEAPEGPIFKLIDSGVNAQPTAPTFTLATDAGDPRRVAAVTVTNASTLNAAQVTLAVQYQVSATTPTKTGTLYTRFRPGTIPTVAFNLPAVLPGSKVWVRMRTERTEYRASAWTSWTALTLDAWVAPASLTVGTKTANSVALSWSLGSPSANTIDPLDVFAYAGASAPADWTPYRVGSLANGSTSITVRNLVASTQYTFGVAFKDEASGAYSSFATATATTNAVNTVSCPAAPKMKVYTSFPDAGTTTGVALAIGAVEGYNIVVQRAPDSSGSPGTWADIAFLPPLTPIFVDPLPSDGATRWYRVFYRLSGFLDGTPGTARSATPIAIPDELVGQNASIITGGATLTFGSYLVGTPDSFYDGATSQSLAVDATSAATANKVVARDNTGSFSANTVTATLNGPAPAGQLTGDTLAANVLTSSLTAVGTIGTGTWQGTSVGKNYGGTGLTSSAFTGVTNERVFAYDGGSGAFFLAPSGSNGQALVYTGGALAWGNPAPGSHVLADTTGLGAQHTTSGLTTGMILQATGATTARFQTPSIPASSVTAGTFSGASYTITNDLTVSGTLTASLPYSSITSKPSYFPADLTSVSGTLSKANGGTSNASWPAANSGEYVVIYDSVTGAERLEAGPQGSTGQALITNAGALTWGNPAPGAHVLATTTALGTEHTVSGLTSGMILQATGATTARFQTPSIPASSVTAGTFAGTSYTITNDLTVSGTLTASLPFSSITGTPTTLAGYGITDALSNSTSSTQNGYFGDLFLRDDVSPSHYLQITNSADLTAARTLSLNVNDASRTISLSGNLTVSGNADISGTSSGTNTGDQTITLTGAVTGTGTGSFATTYAGTVPINKGGTNATTYTVSGTGTRVLVYDSGTGAFDVVSAGTSGQFLRSSGTAGDVLWATPPTFTSSAAGYAPASGGGTTTFLRADGTWATVPATTTIAASGVTAGTFPGALYSFADSLRVASDFTVATSLFKVDSTNLRVGIGTATPRASLDVNGNIFQVWGAGGFIGQVFQTGSEYRMGLLTSDSARSAGLVAKYQDGTGYIWFGAGPNEDERMRIVAAGNVGIGITNPAARLTVSGGGVAIGGFNAGNTANLELGYDGAQCIVQAYNRASPAWLPLWLESQFIRFATGGSEKMRLDASGNVGIGTTSPYSKLDVRGAIWSIPTNNVAGSYAFIRGAISDAPALAVGLNLIVENAAFNHYGLGFSTTLGGTIAQRMVLSSSGDVGIGTSSPYSKLDVRGAIWSIPTNNTLGSYPFIRGAISEAPSLCAGLDFVVENVGSNHYGLGFSTTLGGATSQRMILTSAGNVGIGTTNPSQPLHVIGTSGSCLLLHKTTGGGSGQLLMSTDFGGGNTYALSPFISGVSNGGFSVRDVTSAVERIVIQSGTGNIGINTTSPTSVLHVNQYADNSGITLGASGRGASRINWEMSGTSNEATTFLHNNNTNRFNLLQMARDYLAFFTENTERVRIVSSGNVGIGTTSPNERLEVNGNMTLTWNPGASYRIKFYGGGTYDAGFRLGSDARSLELFSIWDDSAAGIKFITGTGASSSEKMRLTNIGRLGIGTASPDELLHVAGNALASDFILSSDRRRKADLVPITDALAKVLAWAGYTYRPVDGDRRRAGLMAQDVEANAPEVVYTDAEGWKSMSYEQTIPYLVEAIRDLYKLIEARA